MSTPQPYKSRPQIELIFTAAQNQRVEAAVSSQKMWQAEDDLRGELPIQNSKPISQPAEPAQVKHTFFNPLAGP